VQFFIGGSGTTRIRDGSGFVNSVTLVQGVEYGVYIVTNTNDDTYDVYLEEAGVQTQLAEDFAFRNSGDTINQFLALTNSGNFLGTTLVDNIYVELTGENLVNPIPEPTSVAAIRLMSLLALRHRR
jgi:hypothetical protein